MYGPLGWKFIGRLKTPYPVQVICLKSDLKDKIRKAAASEVGIGLDADDDEKFISKERSKYKTMLLSKYTSYLQSKEKYEACQDKVRTEKGHLLRIRQQINYLEGVRQELDDQNRHNKERLKSLSEGFSAKIKEMDELNDSLMRERTKLQNQKEALAGKIREYQHEIQVIKEDSEKSKEILRRLKNYLLYKEL